MFPALERIAEAIDYHDLPEVWRLPNIGQFSPQKRLYGYQRDALQNAARALYIYFRNLGHTHGHVDSQKTGSLKRNFALQYENSHIAPLAVRKYESVADRRNERQNIIFQILEEYMTPYGEEILPSETINRMCFWMATGSGKTLVMVKLIEFLNSLKVHGVIPSCNILILAPSEHLLRQIRTTVEEFNRSGLIMNLIPLRKINSALQGVLGDSITVYYHRSDTISDVQKDVLIDYRRYENNGQWYVLLDEAHKGSKEDSKRQAYYAIMARNGFLFNFSATFTETADVATTVKKYNLEEFIGNGHGKNICLNESEYKAFSNKTDEIDREERKKIVLKSLVTLAHASRSSIELRKKAGKEHLYHMPLMLTLVNKVNTDVRDEKNDLWSFFQTLREIATGEINDTFFRSVKLELAAEWRTPTILFGEGNEHANNLNATAISRMKITDVREAIFKSRKRGALQFIRSNDSKELAFQLKNADSPFALIRIGDTSTWRNHLLAGFEETKTLHDQSYFEELEKQESPIAILMGSRSFFESWDSNRPNVINFINIGGFDAKKFVVQSVGRGVRIETLPHQKRRHGFLPNSAEKKAILRYEQLAWPLETLFLFATNKGAIQSVLEGLETEKDHSYKRIYGFKKTARPKVNGQQEMVLLVPEYKEVQNQDGQQARFALDSESLARYKKWLEATTDSVFTVRDNLSPQKIRALRRVAEGSYTQEIEKGYSNLSFLQERILSYLAKTAHTAEELRELNDNEDIVHFRRVSAQLDQYEVDDLQQKLRRVAEGAISETEKKKLARLYHAGEISTEEFELRFSGESRQTFKSLTIKHIPEHYYIPVITSESGRSDFIKHIVQEESEVRFLSGLEEWLDTNNPEWQAWMFSKIDESVDQIHIPYYDTASNEYRKFFPDFIFWMCRDEKYQITFVDPKGIKHASFSDDKVKGYKGLFEENDKIKKFNFHGLDVGVKLLMFNPEASRVHCAHKNFWKSSFADIFAHC